MDVGRRLFMGHAGGASIVTRRSISARRAIMATSTACDTDLYASQCQKHKSEFDIMKQLSLIK